MARYIDAEALSNDIAKIIKQLVDKGVPCTGLKLLRQIIEDEPTADVAPVKHGRWTDVNNYHIGTCSICGSRWGSVDGMRYCPNCGAKMDEEGE